MERTRFLIARLCGLVAGLALVAMMLITVADVGLRAAFRFPIFGTREIVELLLAVSVFIALPAVFLREEHVTVDVVGPRWKPLLKRIAEVVAALLIAVLVWQSFRMAADPVASSDVTSDLEIRRLYYWIPVVAGLAAGGLAAVLMAVVKRR